MAKHKAIIDSKGKNITERVANIRDTLMNGFGHNYNGPVLSNKASRAIEEEIECCARNIYAALSVKGRASYDVMVESEITGEMSFTDSDRNSCA